MHGRSFCFTLALVGFYERDEFAENLGHVAAVEFVDHEHVRTLKEGLQEIADLGNVRIRHPDNRLPGKLGTVVDRQDVDGIALVEPLHGSATATTELGGFSLELFVFARDDADRIGVISIKKGKDDVADLHLIDEPIHRASVIFFVFPSNYINVMNKNIT